MITARQIRAARALLGWDASTLSDRAGITKEAISRIEGEKVRPHERTLDKIVQAFDASGVEFTSNSGVRLKPQNVEVLEGKSGFARFYDYIYSMLRDHGGKVCVSGVNEKLFLKYHGEHAAPHIKRMEELTRVRDDIEMKILIQENDFDFVSTGYASYRWQKREDFSPSPFYVFGPNLALISFEHDPAPLVILIKSASLSNAYLHSFNISWEKAIEPPRGKDE